MAGLLWYRSYMDSLANTSGYYPDIHAGHADRVAKLTLDAPYLVRETPAGYNQLELMELVGGSVAWNQLCNSSSVTGTSGHKFYLKKSGAESITNTNTFTGLASGTDMVTDLTQMFGSTIADYVYSLEQATAGSGIAWLKSYGYFTEDYIAYSAPTLQSVEATSHVTKDANDNVISTTTFGSVTLRGIPMKDADGNLYYDGDTYSWDGTVTRNYGIVDLGSLSWSIYNQKFISLLPLSRKYSATNKVMALCPAYITYPSTSSGGYNVDKSLWISYSATPELYVQDLAYSNAADFKTAMSGVYLVYELATQTTESADPYTAVQDVKEGGTEEFVTGNNVPVGNVSVYRRA